MPRIWLPLTASAALFMLGCSGSPPADGAAGAGLANPASTYCLEKGGRLEPRKDAQGGEYALCHLPDGRIVEEWALYRQDHGG